MTKTELLDLVSNGENSGVEFKIDTIDNRALAKELVAFTNLQGGIVLLGIDDSGFIQGITRDRIEEWVMTASRDKIRPELIPYFEIIRDVEPGKDIAVVRVEPGWTVHSVWHNSHRTYYIRVGTESREMSNEELERLFQQRGNFRVELRPISGSTIDDLDMRRLSDYFTRIRQQPFPDDIPSQTALLINTELLVEDVDNPLCNLASLILFGKNPNRFLPHASIDAVSYPGTVADYAATERANIRGPLTPLFGISGLVENGIIEQTVQFVQRNTGM
jgi:ATP-dependent DNA helicase RecG